MKSRSDLLCSPLHHLIIMWSHWQRMTMINFVWTKTNLDVALDNMVNAQVESTQECLDKEFLVLI